MAGTLTISTLSDGTNSTSSTNCIQGSAKAWVNFNGTGTVAIRASYNVSSITDNGTGDYTINFTNALSDANYAVCSTGGQKSGVYRGTMYVYQSNTDAPVNYTTSTCRITSVDPNGANVDSAYCSLTVFR